MTDRALLQQALEALVLSTPEPRENGDDYCETGWEEHRAAIIALRERLAQPEQEPVAVIDSTLTDNIDWQCVFFPKDGTKLYTSPPQRQWQGLTLDEIKAAYRAVSDIEWALGGMEDANPFARAIEAKLREKNA